MQLTMKELEESKKRRAKEKTQGRLTGFERYFSLNEEELIIANEGIELFFGFTHEYFFTDPFLIDFDNACCQIMKPNEYHAEVVNEELGCDFAHPDYWMVMALNGANIKYSFGHETYDAAMNVAKEKHDAVRFLKRPEAI